MEESKTPVIEDLPPQDLAILEAGDFPYYLNGDARTEAAKKIMHESKTEFRLLKVRGL